MQDPKPESFSGEERPRQRRSWRSGASGTRFAEASEHFAIYFGSTDGGSALHAAGGFEWGGTSVWDKARISRLHDSMLDPRMLAADHKLREVAPLMGKFVQIDPISWTTGFVVFQPRGWPSDVAKVLSRGLDGGSLVGLAITGEPLRREWVRLETGRRQAECQTIYKWARALDKGREGLDGDEGAEEAAEAVELYAKVVDLALEPIDPSPGDLLDFAARQAEPRLNENPGRRDAFFEPVRKDGESRLMKALGAYEQFLKGLHTQALDRATRLAS